MNTGAIWIIDSDDDDHEMVKQVWQDLKIPNDLIFLVDAEDTLSFLGKVHIAPFIIICELDLPKINGFDLREKMLATHSTIFKSVPFIFWTTQASEDQIKRAYDLSVHGFFIKPSRFEEIKLTFTNILNYWLISKMPAKD
jgi:DNA-binding NarL/FixJ family response regulator